MQENDFVITPMISIKPNKIVFYNKVWRNYETSKRITKVDDFLKAIGEIPEDAVLKKQVQPNKHNFEISPKASQNIKEKISWLYQLAKNKTLINEKTQKQFSFKLNFITLTLPSTQKHQTLEITKKCLNQFLTELKISHNLQNYVWRLEFQKNGNAHYHIATDCFVHYKELTTLWNRCISKLGYVDDYANKFNKISLDEYCHRYNNNGQTSRKTLEKRFRNGTIYKWKNPNTVDVRTVQNDKAIAFYIAKYITKKSDHELNPIVKSREDSETNLRLWFCSRSLSKLKKIVSFIEESVDLIDKFINSLTNVRKYVFDYCTVWFYNHNKETNEHKRSAWSLFNKYADDVGYIAHL